MAQSASESIQTPTNSTSILAYYFFNEEIDCGTSITHDKVEMLMTREEWDEWYAIEVRGRKYTEALKNGWTNLAWRYL